MQQYLVVGIITGCLFALTASGLVVTYTTSGIFNFAHGAIGMFLAFIYWQLSVGWGLPWPIALPLVLLVVAPAFGALIERLFIRSLYGAPLGVTLVVTLGLFLALLGISDAVWKQTITRELPVILPGQVHILGVVVTYFQCMILVVSVLVAVALRILFTRTRAGMTMRAIVDDRDLTARAGASPARVAQLSWAIGASLAALAAILIAPSSHLNPFNLTILVITGYAAAVVGRLKNLPLTVLGAMVLGLLDAYAVGYLPVSLLSDIRPVIPMAMLLVVLLLLPQDRLQTARVGGRKTRRIASLRASLVFGAVFVVGTYAVASILSPTNLIYFGSGIVLGVIMLSLVLLTGYGGQVSLAQMTFAGMGAYFMGNIAGGNSLLSLVAAAVFPAMIGAVLAVAVLRLRGLYLALSTLAFAYAMDILFFNKLLGFGGSLFVGRAFARSQKGFVLEVSILFAALAIGVLALRRGQFGRRLVALNDSEIACASMGMNITTTKVIAFTLAAGIAGLGGAMYGGWQHVVSPIDFQMLQSLLVLLIITVGGVGSVAGAFFMALLLALNTPLTQHVHIPDLQFILIGVGAVSLGRNPGGMAGQMADATARVQSFRASRRHVPAVPTTGAPTETEDAREHVGV